MQIHFDEAQIQAALNEAATKAMTTALSGYTAESSMRDIISKSVLPDLIQGAMTDAMSRVDLEQLTQALAAEIARTITSAGVLVMRNAAIEMILDMQKDYKYDSEGRKKARAVLAAQLGCKAPPEENPLAQL